MLLGLQRGGRILPQATHPPPRIRCCKRLQHSAAAESPEPPSYERQGNVYRGPEQPTRHGPRQPRIYIERPKADLKLKPLEFMKASRERRQTSEESRLKLPQGNNIEYPFDESGSEYSVRKEMQGDVKEVARVYYIACGLTYRQLGYVLHLYHQ